MELLVILEMFRGNSEAQKSTFHPVEHLVVDFLVKTQKCLLFNFLMLLKCSRIISVNPLSVNATKWSNTLKQFADELFECV